jgi:hypothetical protein
MPLSLLLALPVASTAAVAAFAKPLLGAATVLALIWTVAVLVLDFGRSSS